MTTQHLTQWFRQMAVLLDCGIPMIRSLEACSRQTSDAKLRAASAVILDELRVGQRMSQAMRQAGSPFEEVQCGSVEVGERQGDLALVFERLALHSEESGRVRQRLMAALTYPAIVISISLIGLYLLVRFLAPLLSEVSAQMGQQPGPMAKLMSNLGWLFERESILIPLVALTLLGCHRGSRSLWRHHRARVERIGFRIPVLRKLLRLALLIRVCQTLETMIGAGLPLTEALTLAAKTCGSQVYADSVFHPAVARVRRGESLVQSLQDAPGLPSSFTGMMVAGEESGRLEESFGHLATLYEIELTSVIESFLAALEPIAIATVGGIVLGILLSVFLPLYKLVAVA